ncbi:MAG: 3-deoxy-manno-octulosonate cytidylyltransferase [Pseudomonadota bacterium]
MATPFFIIIPARYASTRLPGKLLLDVAGQPLLQHTYERASQCDGAEVIIATDDDKVRQASETFGAHVEMTGESHESGTDRIAEVAARRNLPDDAIVVNVQGDEPLIPPSVIDQVANALATHSEAHVATLCALLTNRQEVFDPNIVKVVRDTNGFALYFSRAPIPWLREEFEQIDGQWQLSAAPQAMRHFRHIGIYAYRAGSLREITQTMNQLRVS